MPHITQPNLYADDGCHPGDRGEHPGVGDPDAAGDAERLQPAPRLDGLLRLHIPLRLHPGELQEAVQHGIRVRDFNDIWGHL